jgi:hypothetical protein
MILIYKYVTIQQPTTEPLAGSDEYSPHSRALFFFRSNLISPFLALASQITFHLQDISAKILYVFLISSMNVMHSTQLILLDLITLTADAQYKL